MSLKGCRPSAESGAVDEGDGGTRIEGDHAPNGGESGRGEVVSVIEDDDRFLVEFGNGLEERWLDWPEKTKGDGPTDGGRRLSPGAEERRSHCSRAVQGHVPAKAGGRRHSRGRVA